MSPSSVAQYLPASQSLFDVVIFDEASQITTWDAVEAIALCGKQTIISVGDPKQLPPSELSFGRAQNDEEKRGCLQDHERDSESIRERMPRRRVSPTTQPNWHYRSRHESSHRVFQRDGITTIG